MNRAARVLWALAAVLAAPWLIEWAVTRRPPVRTNLPRLVRPRPTSSRNTNTERCS